MAPASLEVKFVEEASHWSVLEKPDEVFTILDTFANRL